jgi:hypothetical protein
MFNCMKDIVIKLNYVEIVEFKFYKKVVKDFNVVEWIKTMKKKNNFLLINDTWDL